MIEQLDPALAIQSLIPVQLDGDQSVKQDLHMLKYETLDHDGTKKQGSRFDVQIPVLRVDSVFPGKDHGAASCRGLRAANSKSFQYNKKSGVETARVGQRKSWCTSHSDDCAAVSTDVSSQESLEGNAKQPATSRPQQHGGKPIGKCPPAVSEPVTAGQHSKSVPLTGLPVEDVLDYLFPPQRISVVDPEHAGGTKLLTKVVSRSPGTRQDVADLENSLSQLLVQKHARLEPLCPIREALFSETLSELTRQITIECPERGYMLRRIHDETRMTLDAYEAIYRTACIASTWPIDENMMPADNLGGAQTRSQSGDANTNTRNQAAGRAPAPLRSQADTKPEADTNEKPRRDCQASTGLEGLLLNDIDKAGFANPPPPEVDSETRSAVNERAVADLTSPRKEKQQLQARKAELQGSVDMWKRKLEFLRETTKKELEFAAKDRQTEISSLESKIRLLETLLKGFRKVEE